MLTRKSKIVCNSRHWAVMAWLAIRYPEICIQYRPGIRVEDLDADTCLVSTYPMHLIAAAGHFVNVEYRHRPPSTDLTPEQMQTYGAEAVHYHIVRSTQLETPEVYSAFVSWLAQSPIDARLAVLADLVQRFG